MLDLVATSEEVQCFWPEAGQGFAWWYVDLVGEDGTGIVIIWGARNPFLPAGDHSGTSPSLSVVVYENGQRIYNIHQVYGHEDFERGVNTWRVGRSTFEYAHRFGQAILTIHLDCDVPGSSQPLTANLSVFGYEKMPKGQTNPVENLGWRPFLVDAIGDGVIAFAGRSVRFKGQAYFDTNWSRRNLADLGIRHWCWGRISSKTSSMVFFFTQGDNPQTLVLRSGEGDVLDRHSGTVRVETGGRTRFGTDRALRVVVATPDETVDISLGRPAENGPYYQRYFVQTTLDGETAEGVVERVYIDRMDLAGWNKLVPMAIHRTDGPNSWWLPFFAGETQGRWKRLARLLVSYCVAGVWR